MPKKREQKPTTLPRVMLSIQATPDISGIRTATLFEQDHTVIPCIALVEGVLWPSNAPAPELALAEEFGRFPEGWNGRPVVFDHPKVDGVPVSATSPDVLENNSFGQLFNTTLVGNKLKTEIWINEARVSELSDEAQVVIENLKTGNEVVEVSTGLFLMAEPSVGEFDGEAFESIWRNIVPDHLAVLPQGVKGACSVADGCGAPRTNQMQPVMRACQMAIIANNSTCINPDDPKQQQGLFKRLLESAGNLFNFSNNTEHLSDGDLRTALNAGLATAEPDNFTWILAVFQGAGDSGTFIYEVGFDGTLFQRTFSLQGDTISIGSEATAVRPVTEFVPVEVTANNTSDSTLQENAMSKEKLVNELVANEVTQYTEEDREWLSTLEEEQLAKMAPVVNAETDEEKAARIEAEEAATAEEARLAANALNDPPKPVSTDDYIAAASPEIKEVLESGLRMHRSRKAALVTALTENARCRFTADQLNARTVDELESLAALAQDISFEGQALELTDNSSESEENFTPAPTIFKINKAANA